MALLHWMSAGAFSTASERILTEFTNFEHTCDYWQSICPNLIFLTTISDVKMCGKSIGAGPEFLSQAVLKINSKSRDFSVVQFIIKSKFPGRTPQVFKKISNLLSVIERTEPDLQNYVPGSGLTVREVLAGTWVAHGWKVVKLPLLVMSSRRLAESGVE